MTRTPRARWNPLVPTSPFPPALFFLVILPLLLLPLLAVFLFAFSGGIQTFTNVLRSPEAQFALRFSLLMAFATAAVNGVIDELLKRPEHQWIRKGD